jgi:hypothetical protein
MQKSNDIHASLRPRDELDECLENWEKAIDDWRVAQFKCAHSETMFKAWEAATKSAIMAHKVSAVLAEAKIRSMDEWSDRYLESTKLNIDAETKKRILRLSEAKWESERSRQVSLRSLR